MNPNTLLIQANVQNGRHHAEQNKALNTSCSITHSNCVKPNAKDKTAEMFWKLCCSGQSTQCKDMVRFASWTTVRHHQRRFKNATSLWQAFTALQFRPTSMAGISPTSNTRTQI